VVDITDEPLWVDGDRVRLVQVLTNLLNNAAKFTPPGGLVRVSLVRRGDRAELAVRDNGRGILPENLQYVFTLFAQGEQQGANTHGGLGIGLGLVRQIVVLHEGDVSAFSTGVPGDGSEFVVHLPLIKAPPATPAD
jgi:signal transduction histidine kinase